MKSGSGKRKGSAFERLVCKSFSLWLSGDQMEDLLWRSAMSGGRTTVAFGKGKRFANQVGDISSVHPLGHALIDQALLECKHYRDLGFAGLAFNRGDLAKFWRQVKTQAAKFGKLPMIVARQNAYPIIVCLCREGLDVFNVKLHTVLTAPKLNLYVVPLDEFLKYAKRPVADLNGPAPIGQGEGLS